MLYNKNNLIIHQVASKDDELKQEITGLLIPVRQ